MEEQLEHKDLLILLILVVLIAQVSQTMIVLRQIQSYSHMLLQTNYNCSVLATL